MKWTLKILRPGPHIFGHNFYGVYGQHQMKSWPYQTKMNRNPDGIWDVLEHNHTMVSWILIRNYEFEPWNNKKSFDFHLNKYNSGAERFYIPDLF